MNSLELENLFADSCKQFGGHDGQTTVEAICVYGKWVASMLSDGRCGRAFRFSGAHAVYGEDDPSALSGIEGCIGKDLSHLAAWALEPDDAKVADRMLRRSVLAATMNALTAHFNAPDALEERGCTITGSDDCSFIRPDDHVVMVGAGMLISETVQICGHVDIIDFRSGMALESVLADRTGISYGPRGMSFYGSDRTAELFDRADVICATGCTLVNGTLDGLLRLQRHAREFVLFGPSAQAPFDLLAAYGVTRVVASRVRDGEALLASMSTSFGEGVPPECTESYMADIRNLERSMRIE